LDHKEFAHLAEMDYNYIFWEPFFFCAPLIGYSIPILFAVLVELGRTDIVVCLCYNMKNMIKYLLVLKTAVGLHTIGKEAVWVYCVSITLSK
jgi:hypothetical protein